MILSACLSETDNNQNKESGSTNQGAQVITDDSLENNRGDHDEGNDYFDEEDVPYSEFFIKDMSVGSVFVKNSMGVVSKIDKKVMETLSEFNAIGTESGTLLTLPENILFDFDSYELRSEASKAIDQLAEAIEATDDKVTIVGHTDSKGEANYNQQLSEKRADAVRQALIEWGISKEMLKAVGKGADEPVAKNSHSDGSDNPDGRQKNRRVEVILHGLN